MISTRRTQPRTESVSDRILDAYLCFPSSGWTNILLLTKGHIGKSKNSVPLWCIFNDCVLFLGQFQCLTGKDPFLMWSFLQILCTLRKETALASSTERCEWIYHKGHVSSDSASQLTLVQKCLSTIHVRQYEGGQRSQHSVHRVRYFRK